MFENANYSSYPSHRNLNKSIIYDPCVIKHLISFSAEYFPWPLPQISLKIMRFIYDLNTILDVISVIYYNDVGFIIVIEIMALKVNTNAIGRPVVS